MKNFFLAIASVLIFAASGFAQHTGGGGTAGGGGSGTVTSVTCGNGLTGGTFTVTGTCALGIFAANPQTTTYQSVAADFSSCKTITVASGTFTITLVAVGSQPAAGQCVSVFNYGSGTVTIAPSGQNINGAGGNLSLKPGSATAPTSANIISDGANYFATVDQGTVGTVTSVGLAGTANQITVTGATPITGSGSWTLSLPAAVNLGTDNSVAGTLQLSNGSANAHTILGSVATTSNTVNFFATAPTTGDLVGCVTATTTCTLTDSGVLAANVVNASAPGVGVAHFAGSTQTVTSSLIVAADITSATITGTQIASSVALAGSPTIATTPSVNDNSTKVINSSYPDRVIAAPLLTGNSVSNTVSVITSDFTTTSATLVAITGLSWTLPANTAAKYNVDCNIMYSESTLSTVTAFGIQDVTTAPTNAQFYNFQNTAAGAVNGGPITSLTTTTATSFGNVTPSVTVVLPAHIFGTIEQPSGSASVFQIMVDIASGITLTVKRGSSCRLTVSAN